MKEKTIILFLKKNVWTLLSGLFCLSALFFFLDQRFLSSKKASPKEYISAKSLFERIYANENLSKDSLESACELVNKYPELAKQYQGILSLALAQSGFTKEAENYAKAHLTRLEVISFSFHKDYIETGFLISQNEYEQALQKAIILEENLKKETLYPRLRAVNLMRIAFLGHETKKEEMGKKAFEELCKTAFFPEMRTIFSEGSYTIHDFFR